MCWQQNYWKWTKPKYSTSSELEVASVMVTWTRPHSGCSSILWVCRSVLYWPALSTYRTWTWWVSTSHCHCQLQRPCRQSSHDNTQKTGRTTHPVGRPTQSSLPPRHYWCQSRTAPTRGHLGCCHTSAVTQTATRLYPKGRHWTYTACEWAFNTTHIGMHIQHFSRRLLIMHIAQSQSQL